MVIDDLDLRMVSSCTHTDRYKASSSLSYSKHIFVGRVSCSSLEYTKPSLIQTHSIAHVHTIEEVSSVVYNYAITLSALKHLRAFSSPDRTRPGKFRSMFRRAKTNHLGGVVLRSQSRMIIGWNVHALCTCGSLQNTRGSWADLCAGAGAGG